MQLLLQFLLLAEGKLKQHKHTNFMQLSSSPKVSLTRVVEAFKNLSRRSLAKRNAFQHSPVFIFKLKVKRYVMTTIAPSFSSHDTEK